MKYFVLVCIVALAGFIAASTEDEFRAEYCKGVDLPLTEGCVSNKCNKDGTQSIVLGCGLSQCPGKIIEYKEDKSLPYPNCCPELICE